MKPTQLAEKVDYWKARDKSVWGEGDPETLKLLANAQLSGRWLNLAAGDGRYNLLLLEKADSVVATDADENALAKLQQNTPEEYRGRLEVRAFDLLDPFPFKEAEFDGVFCTGALHFFNENELRRIFGEISRVLKPGGQLIFDFPTNIRRQLPDGSCLCFKQDEPRYSLEQARETLVNLLKNYRLEIKVSEVPGQKTDVGEYSYVFSCKFLLVRAQKRARPRTETVQFIKLGC
ncbi:MAG: class I SAM-dependent methyltransferase [Candidatus Micrarchaeota archaeon]